MKLCILLHLISCLFASDPPDPIDPLEAQLKKVHKRPPTDSKGRILPIDYTVRITSTFLSSFDTASLSVYLWLVEEFHNPSLGWNLDEYPQKAIPVSPDDIYIPHLRSCSAGKLERTLPSEIQVDHTGLVTIRSDGFMTAMCRPSYDRYPFDHNHCIICFETHRAGAQANLTVDLSDNFVKGTPEVRFVGDLTFNESYTYEEGGISAAEVKINLFLQRNPTVIMLMIFTPALLLYIEIFLVMRFPDIEEFKMLLEGTSVYATLNLAIVEVLARTNSLPGLGKYTTGSQIVLLLLSLTFVLIRYWSKKKSLAKFKPKKGKRDVESWHTKRYGVQLLEESQSSTPSSFGYPKDDYRRYLKRAREWVEGHSDTVAIGIVSAVALIAPIFLSLYSFT